MVYSTLPKELSHTYPAHINIKCIDGKNRYFTSVAHYLEFTKCLFSKNSTLADEVYMAMDAEEASAITKRMHFDYER